VETLGEVLFPLEAELIAPKVRDRSLEENTSRSKIIFDDGEFIS
jgi:hypothetical protein